MPSSNTASAEAFSSGLTCAGATRATPSAANKQAHAHANRPVLRNMQRGYYGQCFQLDSQESNQENYSAAITSGSRAAGSRAAALERISGERKVGSALTTPAKISVTR